MLGDQAVGGCIDRQLKRSPAKRRMFKHRNNMHLQNNNGHLLWVLDEVPPVRLQPPEDILGERYRLDG